MLSKQHRWPGRGRIIHLMEVRTGKQQNKCHLVGSSPFPMRNQSPEIGDLFSKGIRACPGVAGAGGHTSLHPCPLCWPSCAKIPLPKVSTVTLPRWGWNKRKPGATWHTHHVQERLLITTTVQLPKNEMWQSYLQRSFLLLGNSECDKDNYSNLRNIIKVKPTGYRNQGMTLIVLDVRCLQKDLAAQNQKLTEVAPKASLFPWSPGRSVLVLAIVILTDLQTI